MRQRLPLLCSLLLALACASAPSAPENDLAAARARWARAGIHSYDIVVHRSCECIPEMTGPVRVEVRNGVVQSRRYVDSDAVVASPELAAEFTSVEELFAKVEAALARPVAHLEASYDPRTGVPLHVLIDHVADMVDDEVVYTMSDLQRR